MRTTRPRNASRTTSNGLINRWVSISTLKKSLIVLLAVVALALPIWLVSAAATNVWRKPRVTAPPSNSHAKRNLNSASVATNPTVVVEPGSLQGWVDFDDSPGTGSGSGGFAAGPGTAPLGAGSAFLRVDANGRHGLGTTAFLGTRMDAITELTYWSYQNNNTNTAAAISLQFDIDYDLNDGTNSYMGRLVFEPYISNTVQQGVWQNWDALAGKWWGTRTTVTVGDVAGVVQPCQQATPCTWAQVLSLFPNAGVGNTPARALLFKAGGPVGAGGFDGYVDDFSIKINTAAQTYDFEPPNVVWVDDDFTGPNGSDPAGPATAIGYDAFKTIQEGVTAVAAGGTVNVAAGSYTEQITISKSLTLTGENTGTTVLHAPATLSPRIGGHLVLVQMDTNAVVDMSGINIAGPHVAGGCSAAVFYGIFVAGGANLNLHNAAMTDIRLSPDSLLGCQDGIAVRAGSLALGQTGTLTVNNVAITGYQKAAIVVDNTSSSGTITNNTITGLGQKNIAANAIQIGRGAVATITGNSISANECTSPVCGSNALTQTTSTGILVFQTNGPVSISNNTISDNDTGIYNNAPGTIISGNTMVGNRFNGILQDEGSSIITSNSLTGSMNVGVAAVSFNGNTGDSTATLTGNTIVGATTGLQLLDETNADAFVPALTANFNRIVSTTNSIGNSPSLATTQSRLNNEGGSVSSAHAAIVQAAAVIEGTSAQWKPVSAAVASLAPVTNDLENNWWGCNAGPGNPGCGSVSGSNVDFSPWFVVSAQAVPNAIASGATSNISVDLTHNSDNAVPASTSPNTPVSYGATNGNMTPAAGTITAGAAGSTFTSTSINSAVVTVTVDNENLNLPIAVFPSFSINDVTMNEGNAGTTSFTFTITKTGDGAGSVDYSAVNGTAIAPTDYTAIPATTLNFLGGDASKQVTVQVNGDTAVEANETFNVHLSNAVNATISDADGLGTITNDDNCGTFSTVYVDDNWAGTSIGTDPDGAGPATSFGCDSFATIQEGINAVTSGGTVIVHDGTYAEQLSVNKPVSVLGPNAAINPNGGVRVAEATIIPTASNPIDPSFNGPIVVYLQVPGITFKGFTVDGNNPSLTSGTTFNGSDVDAEFGIYGDGAGDLNAVVENNIVQNIGEFGIWLDSFGFGGTRNNSSRINTNKVDNILGTFFGQGIRIADDAWLDVTNNVVTRVRSGIVIENYSGNVTTHPASVISGNNITSYRIGIRHNLHYVYGAPGFTIQNNTIQPYVQTPAPLQPVTAYQGIRVESIQQTVAVTVQDNVLTGNKTAMQSGGYTSDDGLFVTNASSASPNILFNHNDVRDFLRGAFNETPAVPDFECNLFTGNATGIEIDAAASNGLIAHQNNIFNNGAGMQNNSAATVDATNNYWGRPSGPTTASNPGGTGDTISTNVTFNPFLTANATCAATISYTINASTGANGSISPNGAVSVAYGESQTFNITPDPHYHIADVLVDGGSVGAVASYTFNGVVANHTISASFAITQHTITASAGANGSISPSGAVIVNDGSDQAFTITANGGFHVQDVLVDSISVGPVTSYSFTNVAADHTISATFALTCGTQNTVYVDDSWVGTASGSDPDGGGPATSFGCDAFATIQDGINGVAPGGTVIINAGTYNEDVNVNKNGVSLLGAGAGSVTVVGPIGGAGSTIAITDSNVTVAGMTITRAGNNTTDWNNPNLNTAGISIQGQAITNTLIRDNVITANRTGIDINNSNGHTVRNNVINDNRTGVILRNQTDNLTVVENFITNNWTVGVLFLDASSGTNSPVQTAHHSNFNNNDLSGNWYGQIVDRQSGGSLPAPGTTNLKNFKGNWFGTASPVTTTANSTEPGYAAQIPVAFGGSATPPGGQPDIAGPASANFQINPLLTVGTDTNVETTPGRGTNGFQGVAINQTIVVEPSNLQGWVDFDDLPGTGTGSAGFTDGPGTSPLGAGSAFLRVDANGRHALGTTAYMGTRMDDITELKYWSYQNNNTNTAAAISLQFDIDYDLNDGVNSYMGRLVFEPYISNTVQQGVWQNWDALAGKWWGTRTTVTVGGVAGVAQPCQQATPCTWAQVLSLFPNAGVGNTPARALLFKAGGPVGAGGFDGNVDDFSIKINTAAQTYDFEPNPHLSINDVSHNEGNAGTTSYDFTVTLSRASSSTVTVDYTTANGSAVAPGDFTALATTQLTFNPGETTKAVTVLVNGDLTNETDEQFFINLSNAANADITDNQGLGTIVNDDALPTFSIDDVTHSEGNSGTTAYVFTITKTGATAFSSSVNFQTADGTATVAGNDYQPQTGSLTFLPGDTTQTVTVLVNGDTALEPDETFTLNLSGATNATINDNQGVGTIISDDTDVSVAVSPSTVLEDGATNLVYTFTRNGNTTAALTINFSVAGGAAFGTDYTQSGAASFTATNGTVTFAAGSSTATVTIDPTSDATVEPDETVILTVASGSGYAVGSPNAATGTITNDDTDVSVAVSPSTVLEDGATNLVYTFTRNGNTTGALTVNFSVAGSAAFGTDYTQSGAASFTATNGSVTFAAGSSTATVTIDPTTDATVETDETVILTVTSGTGYNVASPNAATGTITNDDTDVSVAVSPSTVLEDGATNLVYTFTRNGNTTGTLTVNFAVAGTATFNSDYTQSGAATFGTTNGTVTFAAGSSTATVTIDPTTDAAVEPDETVILTVTSGTGYNVATPTAATGTITNDDTDVSVAVSSASVLEDGTINLVYTFTRNGDTTGALTANFGVAGTATFNSDYTQSGAASFTATNGTVTFAAGSSTATVTIDPTADPTDEPDETVIFTVASGSGYGVGSPSAASGTIANDDSVQAPTAGILQFNSATYSTTEGSFFATITVQRVGDTTGAVSVDYATPDDSAATSVVPCETISGVASPRCDFTTAVGTLHWAAGDNAPKSFVVLISDDNYVEGPEGLTLTLSNPTGGAQLGSPSTANLTINDDVTEPSQNPIDSTPVLVRQSYHDFLNREPDTSGFNFWNNQIETCGVDPVCREVRRIDVSASFYLSIEFQGTGYFVERLYKSSYGDATGTSTIGGPHQLAVPIVKFSELLRDTQEIGKGVIVLAPGWEAALEANKVAFTEEFVQRARFLNAYPLSMTPAQFVDALNANSGHPLSTAERDQLVTDLTGGAKTRAQVLRAVADDQDLINAEFNRGFVLMQYFGFLRRNPDAAPDLDHTGYDFWLTKLNNFNGNYIEAEMVKAFLTSFEYRKRAGAN